MLDINPTNSELKLDVSIIIINYELAKEIENCLASLLPVVTSNSPYSYEIIIVDNKSQNNDLLEVEKKFQRDTIRFYYLDHNVGFGKGCNYGFTKARGRYICFLNPDTLVIENIFPRMIALFDHNKTIGVIGPQQQVRAPFFDFSAGFSPSVFIELVNLLGLGVFFEGFLVSAFTKIRKKEFISVHWILGACIFITAKLFKEIDGFDKDYFLFYEEVDLCRRVINRGLKIAYVPSLAIHHVGSVSAKRNYYLYTLRTYSSKYLFITKHYAWFSQMMMRVLLYLQVLSQMIIWTILFPVNGEKSKQKLRAFIYLFMNRMINKIDDPPSFLVNK